jgi:hypothetical protein
MPEFILDHGTAEAARTFASLDPFTQGYIEAMFFTDASDPDDGDLQDATFADLAPETLAKIIRDCEQFQTAHAAMLQAAYDFDMRLSDKLPEIYYDEESAGRDYWYTRNGHGTGFWDRGLGDVGDALAAAARYSDVDLYRGDDGKIYF